ncbi:unnamed protein product [Diatraea saccharalis]|uniref:Nodal modulator 1 n=1 Tax=Diatraea saccharalis TaxID=40085 RepID=A0A9N9RHT1_9NEOP|nr:unnamed protein product [Diatraea saccharalis]
MAPVVSVVRFSILIIILLFRNENVTANDILGCGGFVKSHVTLDFSKIEIGLYTKEGSLKEKTECAPTNGYYFLPLYEKGEYILKVHPPAGWSFEPSQVKLVVDGTTDQCSTGQDINFAFNGFGITGRVITAGQKQGPSGISVQLINQKGEVRNTVTSASGDFHFTPVIPGKYTLKASHPRWKLEPSQAVVQVTEGNTALPVGVLAVKGYDVRGSVTSFGAPLSGLHVLLYSKETNQQLRVEGCKTALLQGVPDSPICYSITDNNGEFSFGLVPAGNYKLLTLSTSPGQASISYNVKPESVPFSVLHDSLFIRNAFEVHGFTVVGTVVKSIGGEGLSKARVLLDKQAIGNTDVNGKFTLPQLQPGTYSITFQHEQCEVEPVQLQVSASGARPPAAVASRWRVCGVVAPAGARRLTIQPDRGGATVAVHVAPDSGGKWCTFLPSGVYSAKVDLSEQEQREGLQFYPLSHKITVGNGPVEGISFSQLKGTVSGKVRCKRAADCVALPIRLRALSPDGAYFGNPRDTTVTDGEYRFPEVTAGSAEVSVGGTRLCWRERSHIVPIAGDKVQAPDFVHTGYILRLRASHPVQVEYSGPEGVTGTLSVPEGASEQCVPKAGTYTLIPRSCHKFSPATVRATPQESEDETPMTVYFVAVAHEVTVRVLSPEAATDVTLLIGTEDHGAMPVGPLKPSPHPDGGFAYEHTMYMADGEVGVVSASSSSLLFDPQQPQQVWGRGSCQPNALTFRARRALTLAGALRPPVPGVHVTLTADGVKQTHITTEDGKYSFGPLDASKKYTVTAELESYVFSEPDENGIISARKLAEITVQLLDRVDKTPLQGGLVSVSGGSYRRTAVTDAAGRLRFAALAPDQYYVKPNMKEYRFHPPHTIVPLPDGEARHLELTGERVAWSCVGRLMSLGGMGWAGAVVAAVPKPESPATFQEKIIIDFFVTCRIRGLLPSCVYTIQLKESSLPELVGLKLAKAPSTLEVKNNKDIENVILIAVQPRQLTDGSVLIHAAPAHYKMLRLTLATEKAPHSHIYAAKLDPPNGQDNPGVMLVLPRLPADNATYVLQLESTLSKATHTYEDTIIYFESDGNYKTFDIEFKPKVKSSDQELRQTSFLVVPLLGLLALAYMHRDALLARVMSLSVGVGGGASTGGRGGTRGVARPDVLDAASIDHIVSAVNAAGKRTSKKKQQ